MFNAAVKIAYRMQPVTRLTSKIKNARIDSTDGPRMQARADAMPDVAEQ